MSGYHYQYIGANCPAITVHSAPQTQRFATITFPSRSYNYDLIEHWFKYQSDIVDEADPRRYYELQQLYLAADPSQGWYLERGGNASLAPIHNQRNRLEVCTIQTRPGDALRLKELVDLFVSMPETLRETLEGYRPIHEYADVAGFRADAALRDKIEDAGPWSFDGTDWHNDKGESLAYLVTGADPDSTWISYAGGNRMDLRRRSLTVNHEPDVMVRLPGRVARKARLANMDPRAWVLQHLTS